MTVAVERAATATLRVRFTLDGDLQRVALPVVGEVRPGLCLWEHTCVEIFIAARSSAYHELNVAPSRAWQWHAFAGYRDGGPLADDALAPRIAVERGADRLVIDVELAPARLSPSYATAPLRLGLTAVVEDDRGALSYWALAHRPDVPDFHHAEGFVVALDPPTTSVADATS